MYIKFIWAKFNFENNKFCVSCCCLGNSLVGSSEQFGQMYFGFNNVSMQSGSAYCEF